MADGTARLPDTPRRWPTWVRGGLVPVVLMFGNYLVALPLILLAGRMEQTSNRIAAEIVTRSAQVSVTVFSLFIIWMLMRHFDRRPLREAGVGITKGSLPAFALGVLASALAVVPIGLVLQNAGQLRGGEPGDYSVVLAVLVAIIPGVLMQGFPEELVFRGYLTQTLPRTWGPWAVSLYSSAIFGVMHLASAGGQQNLAERFIYLLLPFGFAFLACALQRLTGQLWAAVGVHGGLHLATTAAAWAGVGEGPVLWTGQAICYVVLGALVMIWLDRTRPGLPVRTRLGQGHASA